MKNVSAVERFLAKVDVTDEGCLRWTGTVLPNGYGHFRGDLSQMTLAHRFAYETFVGPIPRGLHIDHLCRNRLCVNPAHLEPVTCRENALRGEAPTVALHLAGRCARGHTDFVTLVSEGRTRRICRTCRNERSKEHQRRRRAAERARAVA